MAEFWHRHRRLSITGISLLVLMVVLLVVPYAVPLGKSSNKVEIDSLVNENSQFLDIEGMSIYIEDHNPQSTRETMVFIHGLGGSSFSWRHNVSFFVSQGYRAVTLDMKGFGLSHKDFKSDHSHPAQAAIIFEIFERLSIDHAYLIGHSMGTSVMFHFADMFPEKTLGMVSVAGALNFDDSSFSMATLLGFGPFNRAGMVFLTHYENRERIRGILESAYYERQTVSDDVFDGYYYRLTHDEWYASLLAMTRDIRHNNISFKLEDMDFPTLIIWGEHDSWVTRDDIKAWKDKMPVSQFFLIHNAAHMPMEERPELFNKAVLTFIEDNQGRLNH